MPQCSVRPGHSVLLAISKEMLVRVSKANHKSGGCRGMSSLGQLTPGRQGGGPVPHTELEGSSGSLSLAKAAE